MTSTWHAAKLDAIDVAGTRAEQHLEAGGGRAGGGVRGALLAALALLLVACVGLGAGRPLWRIGGPPRLVDPSSYSGDLVIVGFGLLAVSPLIVSAIRRRQRPKRVEPELDPDVPPVPLPWWGRVLAALAVAASVVVALLILTLLPTSGSDPAQLEPKAGPGESATPPVLRPDGGLPPVHWWGYAALTLVVLAGVAVAWRLREPRPEPRVETEPDELLEALDLSLEDLEQEPDPRRAVIRAYARMEGALGRYGLARHPSETTLEYLARALTSLRVGRPSVERLTALYERAKFSRHEIDLSMKAEALAALGSLRDELAEAAA